VWEIRSVNHRFFDAHLRLPDELKSLESGCRQRIGKCLNRGRIDAGLKFERNQAKYQQASLNKSALAALQDAISQVRQILPDAAEVSPIEILRWPGVLSEPEEDFEKFFFIRSNPKGVHFERWRHVHGCARFFNAARDTVTDRFLMTYKAGEPRPEFDARPEGKPAGAKQRKA